MLNFKREPFIYLPFNDIELFDLASEYCISLLEKIDFNYSNIIRTSSTINNNMSSADFELYKECFGHVEACIEYYSKLVKSVKLSIGQQVGKVISKQTIFDDTSYNPNAKLQEKIVHGLRNTSQHFEERLQDFQNQVDPFLQLYYSGLNMYWEIIFGKGGYRHSGNRGNWETEIFDINKLFLKSYRIEEKQLISETVSISEIWTDTIEINNLVESNIEKIRQQKRLCCPPVRGLSIFMTPDKPE